MMVMSVLKGLIFLSAVICLDHYCDCPTCRTRIIIVTAYTCTLARQETADRLAREILYGFYFLQPQRWRGGGIKKQKIKKKCYLVLEGSKRPSIKKDRKEKLSKQVKAHIDKKEY